MGIHLSVHIIFLTLSIHSAHARRVSGRHGLRLLEFDDIKSVLRHLRQFVASRNLDIHFCVPPVSRCKQALNATITPEARFRT